MSARGFSGGGRSLEEAQQRAATASSRVKLKKFLLRYYPPGIILEYTHNGELMQRSVDLLDLTAETDTEAVLNQIVEREKMIKEAHREPLRKLIFKLQAKLGGGVVKTNFALSKVLRAHILPLTNCAFNKGGDKFITGSYDRTCKVWSTDTSEELQTLEGHKNVVHAIAFNNPYGDRVLTGSFDKTAKLWDASTGQLYHTMNSHTA